MKIGYARVSTDDQNLAMQLDALRAAGCEKIHEDKASGVLHGRKGLTEALKGCAAGDVLVVWKLDRLARSLHDLVVIAEDLKGRDVGLKILTGEGAAVDTTHPQGRMIFGILAVTGMRVNEALHLDKPDVDLDQGILTIRRTKFGKSRHVPIHSSTLGRLKEYAEKRDRVVRTPPSQAFFVSERGTRITEWIARYTFAKLSQQLGFRRMAKGHGRGPRLHDMRHRFCRSHVGPVVSTGTRRGTRTPEVGHLPRTRPYQ